MLLIFIAFFITLKYKSIIFRNIMYNFPHRRILCNIKYIPLKWKNKLRSEEHFCWKAKGV